MDNGYENQEPQRFDTPESQPVPYQPQYDMSADPSGKRPNKKHKALAIASLVLSGLSLCCCWIYVIGIVPALIGAVFGLIALVGGKDKSVRIMGGIGMGLGIIGIGLSLFMLIGYIAVINWDNLTMENLQKFRYIDPENRREVMEWMQQFFNQDISSSSSFYYGIDY